MTLQRLASVHLELQNTRVNRGLAPFYNLYRNSTQVKLLYEKAMQLNNNPIIFTMGFGLAHKERNRFEFALECSVNSRQVNQNYMPSLMHHANTLFKPGCRGQAAEVYQTIASVKYIPQVLGKVAHSYQYMGAHKHAVWWYQKAIELEPYNDFYKYNLGVAWMDFKPPRLERVKQLIEGMPGRNQNSYHGRLLKIVYLITNKTFIKALAECNFLLKLTPEDKSVLGCQIHLLNSLRQYAAAHLVGRRAFKLYPFDSYLLCQRVNTHHYTGQNKPAESLLRLCEYIQPYRPIVLRAAIDVFLTTFQVIEQRVLTEKMVEVS